MIQYKNVKGNLVTGQQVQMMDAYNIETLDDVTGKLKIIERFRHYTDTPSKYFEYFLGENEDKNAVIQTYGNKEFSTGVLIYLNKQSANGFDLWDYEAYLKTGELTFKGKTVFDNQNREIFSCNVDKQTNEIIDVPSKHYYGTSNDPEGLQLEFKYERDPQTNEIKVYIDDDNETSGVIHTMKQSYFIEIFGQDFWDAHPYYHSLLPILPTSVNI
ncbi:MAG: hypothetical protein LBE36_13980 [Flavobacteriaceae bacterium]|jgi:hypothetical protein|nr:hypothetical protein [Flavobacteriaceae bacterium]